MKIGLRHRAYPWLITGTALLFPGFGAGAADDAAGISLAIDLGAGEAEAPLAGDDSESAPYLGFRLLYRLAPKHRIGLELSGWTLESGSLYDPSEGEGLSQVYFIWQYAPNPESGWYIRAGGGFASYWNNESGLSLDESGSGFALGVGYDYALADGWSLSPLLTFSSADIDGEDHEARAIAIGIVYDF